MDSALLIIIVVFGSIILFLATGMWIAVALGLIGVALVFIVDKGPLSIISTVQWHTVNTFTFTAVPLFILMGEILLESGITDRLYRGITKWVGFIPGGLLHSNIASCAVFAAVSGSSVATAATIGTMAIPELEKRGYNKKLIYGSIAGGGTLGILIPPSIGMILYGAMVGESVSRLFIAGFFPGIALAGLFMAYIVVVSIMRPHMVPERLRFSLKGMVSSALDVWPTLVLIFMVLGTIYLGVATPTEAAAMGVFGALFFAVLYRRLNRQMLKQAGLNALKIQSWIMLIVIGAKIMAMGLSYMQVPSQLAQWVASLAVDRLVILVIIGIMYMILGCFIECISMMVLTLPVVYPLMMALGFDSIWFGVILVVFIEMGQITPPVGVNLYVIHGITGKKYLHDVIVGALPFFVCQIVLLIILSAFPSLATWLPKQMIQRF